MSYSTDFSAEFATICGAFLVIKLQPGFNVFFNNNEETLPWPNQRHRQEEKKDKQTNKLTSTLSYSAVKEKTNLFFFCKLSLELLWFVNI